MAYYGRKPLSPEQRKALPDPRGGVMTPEQQDTYIALLYSCNNIKNSCYAMNVSPQTLANTRKMFPDFEERLCAVKETWCDAIEDTIFAMAIGPSGTVEISETDKTYLLRREPGTNLPMLDEHGKQIIDLAKVRIRTKPPDVQAQLICLRSWRPDIYQNTETLQIAAEIPPDPEQFRETLRKLADDILAPKQND